VTLDLLLFLVLHFRQIDLEGSGAFHAGKPIGARIVPRAHDHQLRNALREGSLDRIVDIAGSADLHTI
jgi:hypothetical protein